MFVSILKKLVFAIEVAYENLPAFCSHCKNIGHHKEKPVENKDKMNVVSQKQHSQKWQPKDNPNGIGSSRAFETPAIQPVPIDVPVAQQGDQQSP